MSADSENQGEAELVRRYRQAIEEHVRRDAERVAGPEGGSILLDDVPAGPSAPPALGRSPRARWPVLAEPRRTGVELQWHDVVAPTHHTLLTITPTNQARYENDPRFRNFDEWGRRYATLGGGPDPMSFLGMFIDGELKSDHNRSGDIVRHGSGLRIDPVSSMTEDEFINILFKLDREYANDLPYSIITRDAQKRAKVASGVASANASTTSPGHSIRTRMCRGCSTLPALAHLRSRSGRRATTRPFRGAISGVKKDPDRGNKVGKIVASHDNRRLIS